MSIKIIFASPGEGKSYLATKYAYDALKKGRVVFSNYPIITPGGLSACIWKAEYALENVHDAVIIIDEAYRDMSSRDFKKFTVEEHTFFATNRHNNLDIYLLAQNPARIDVILREITSEFLFMKKISIPFTWWLNKLEDCNIPFLFIAYGYLDELSLARRHDGDSDTLRYAFFNRKVAKSYDTHFFSNDDAVRFEGVPWITLVKNQKDIKEKNHLSLWTLKPWQKMPIVRKIVKNLQCVPCRVACSVSWVRTQWSTMKLSIRDSWALSMEKLKRTGFVSRILMLLPFMRSSERKKRL